eukprot:Pompholyxophrys_punicea_v1_NODE_463_length_1898_cov_5.250136.p3 type:complete len:107 gc:universal NODE_463_length_1898_cov_5.250136:1207-887(-)
MKLPDEVSTAASEPLFIPPHPPISVDLKNMRAFTTYASFEEMIKKDPTNEDRFKNLVVSVGLSPVKFQAPPTTSIPVQDQNKTKTVQEILVTPVRRAVPERCRKKT